jgi:carboxyl-terminal processing protease
MRTRSTLAALLVALAVTGGAPIPASQPAAARTAEQAKSDTKVYDEVWELARKRFYDAKMLGLDWKAIGDEHRAAYAAAETDAERSAAINAMLGALGSSHTHHYTKDETAYYELVDIFSYHLRHDIPRHLGSRTVSYPGIGMFTKTIDGKIFVSAIYPGLPADKAGLRVGDEIISADGKPFGPVASFRSKKGELVELKVRRTADATPFNIAVRPTSIEPDEVFEQAITDSARIIEANGRRIGYVRVWNYAGEKYQSALIDVLNDGKLKDADALIWDLRDGWGGAQPRYLNIFNPYGPTLTLTDRDGDTHTANFRWRKPVALLINEGTRSGKEVLTYGFKKNGFGPVIGERTAGALLAGTAILLSDGSLLILAVNDAAVDGVRLEGDGVAPTVEVPFDIRYANGKDPQLDKAVELLAEGA